MEEITKFLTRVAGDKKEALDQVIPFVESELHAIARRLVRGERTGHTLQATALVNEAYLRLAGGKDAGVKNRRELLALAAKKMWEILLDHARKRSAQKRPDGKQREPLADVLIPLHDRTFELVALKEAMEKLAALDRRLHETVVLHFFGGLSTSEISELRNQHRRGVQRDLKAALAILFNELAAGESAN